jgi:hypothetical protein
VSTERFAQPNRTASALVGAEGEVVVATNDFNARRAAEEMEDATGYNQNSVQYFEKVTPPT